MQNLARNTALFITASDLLLDLGKQESARALKRRIRYYAGTTLPVTDEISVLGLDNRNPDLLFQIVSRRYEKKSLVLTTNFLFCVWSTIFPNAMCATALIKRVVHHADVISIQGKRYRTQEAEQDTQERAKRRRKVKPKPDSSTEPQITSPTRSARLTLADAFPWSSPSIFYIWAAQIPAVWSGRQDVGRLLPRHIPALAVAGRVRGGRA